MPEFGHKSLERLSTCDPPLQWLFNTVIERYDCTILEGERGQERQNLFVEQGLSKVKWPDGKHNVKSEDKKKGIKSKAVDVAPWINGKASFEPRQCYFFAGYVKRVAEELEIKIRLGADWDSDGDVNDQTFRDIVHFELAEER